MLLAVVAGWACLPALTQEAGAKGDPGTSGLLALRRGLGMGPRGFTEGVLVRAGLQPPLRRLARNTGAGGGDSCADDSRLVLVDTLSLLTFVSPSFSI